MRLIPNAVRNLFTRKPAAQAMHVRRWQAAQNDRFTAGWLSTQNSINQELRTDLNALRARGRDLVKNNDYAKKYVGMCGDNIIGPAGVRLQVRIENKPGEPDALANDAIERGWDEWKKVADITGKQHFDEMCRTMIESMPSDGEFLVREVMGKDAGNKFNYALQLIDVDRIDTQHNIAATNNTNAIIMGVEVNAYRRPVALHIFTAHPSDGQNSSRTRERIDVKELIHAFKVENAEQLRGIPWMAPGMLSLYHLGGFMLSALLAAEHGANHYGFFTAPDGQSPIGTEDATSGEQIVVSQPGVFDTLPTGTEFQQFESKYPDNNFGPFVKAAGQRLASGWRVAYHSLFNDLEGVSFSSIRSGTLEERDRWTCDQNWFVNICLNRIKPNWLKMSLLGGALTMPNGSPLPAAKLEKFSAHQWQPRAWDWVDPAKDMAASIEGINAGVLNPIDEAAKRGNDFEDNLKKKAQAQALAAKYKVSLPAYDSKPGANSAPGAAPQAAAA